jgi:hypothetical protein
VTLQFPAFLSEFSSSLQCHVIQQVAASLTWAANAEFFATSNLPLQFVLDQIKYFGLITMVKVKRTPCKPLGSTNLRGLVAKVVATVKAAPSNCCI